MTSLCVLDHDTPRLAAHPLVVCQSCHDHVEQAIAETPHDYATLAHQLTPNGSSATARTSGTKDVGISLDHRVSQLRTDIRNTVSTWARIAVEERGMNPPADTVPSICTWLVKQADWYLGQPWAAQFANDMLENHRQARWLNDPHRARMFEVADCPEPTCTGRLWARIRPADALLPHDITCDESPEADDGTLIHYWPADKWMTLGRRIDRVRTQKATA